MIIHALEGNSVNMAKDRSVALQDFRGKTVVIATHMMHNSMKEVRADLAEYVVTLPNGQFKVTGFVLGKVVDQSVHSQVWVDFPWSNTPILVDNASVIKILLDDEAEPDTISGMPCLGGSRDC